MRKDPPRDFVLILVALLFLALSLGGCGGGGGGGTDVDVIPCNWDSDCPMGRICNLGYWS